MDGLLIGVFIGFLNHEKKLVKLPASAWNLIFIVALTFLVTVMSWKPIMENDWYFVSILLLVMPLVFGLLVSSIVVLNIQYVPKLVVSISTLSYALYLVHYPLIPLAKKISHLSADNNVLIFYSSYIILSLLSALLLHYIVEKPFLILKSKVSV